MSHSGAQSHPKADLRVRMVFYVSTRGNDEWSGALSEPNAEGTDGPFATIRRARDALRALRAGDEADRPALVLLRGGTYFLDEPLVLGPEDSGTQLAPVTYAAYPGEEPIISGGRPITGWRAVERGGRRMWAAEVPEVKRGEWSFHQLFVNGERRPRPRLPKGGFYRVADLPDRDPEKPAHTQNQDRFRYAMGDIKPWHNLQDVEVVVLHLWVESRLPIETVDEAQRMVSFSLGSVYGMTDDSTDRGARYYVENVFEAMDAPGEWYLDRPEGTLYYMPRHDERPETLEAIAPRLERLVRLEGEPEQGRFVEHVHFEGLTFAHNEWWITPDRAPERGGRKVGGSVQAAHLCPGAIHAEGARHCSIRRCRLARLGTYAVELGRGCKDFRIEACEIRDLGAGGIKIGETVLRQQEGERTAGNAVTDCRIADGGKIFHSAVGVWIGHSSHNIIAHNDIHGLYYTGVSVGWRWGYGASGAHHNVVEYNHIHDIGRGWLSDMGGIYTLGPSPGSALRGNVIHDVEAHLYGGWAIYPDEGTSYMLIEDNVCYDCKHCPFHQHYGRENLVRNNVFAFGRQAQIARSRIEPHVSFIMDGNIFFGETGEMLSGNWGEVNCLFDRNLYWDPSGRPITFAGASFEQWQARGMDEGSLIADPLFVDAAARDLRLRPDSPAFRLGFRPLDPSRVGPRRT